MYRPVTIIVTRSAGSVLFQVIATHPHSVYSTTTWLLGQLILDGATEAGKGTTLTEINILVEAMGAEEIENIIETTQEDVLAVGRAVLEEIEMTGEVQVCTLPMLLYCWNLTSSQTVETGTIREMMTGGMILDTTENEIEIEIENREGRENVNVNVNETSALRNDDAMRM